MVSARIKFTGRDTGRMLNEIVLRERFDTPDRRECDDNSYTPTVSEQEKLCHETNQGTYGEPGEERPDLQ
jgi:hypothetical protein